MKVNVYWRQKSTTPFLSKGQWITLLVGIICIITTITTASSQPKNKLEADSKTVTEFHLLSTHIRTDALMDIGLTTPTKHTASYRVQTHLLEGKRHEISY